MPGRDGHGTCYVLRVGGYYTRLSAYRDAKKGIIKALHISIRREAQRCSFKLEGQMPQPQESERATDTDSHALFYI